MSMARLIVWFTRSRLRWCHMWAKIPVFTREISRDFSAL